VVSLIYRFAEMSIVEAEVEAVPVDDVIMVTSDVRLSRGLTSLPSSNVGASTYTSHVTTSQSHDDKHWSMMCLALDKTAWYINRSRVVYNRDCSQDKQPSVTGIA